MAHLFAAPAREQNDTHVFAANPASAAVLTKAGFREIGRSDNFSIARGEVVTQRVFRLERAESAGSLEPAHFEPDGAAE